MKIKLCKLKEKDKIRKCLVMQVEEKSDRMLILVLWSNHLLTQHRNVAVSLGAAAVLLKVTFSWYGITTVHIVICLLVSFQLDSIHVGYTWKFDSPRGKTTTQILRSITDPLSLNSFTWVKGLVVSFNVINWTVAGVGLWMFTKSQDFATYILVLFILNVFLFSVVYLKMEHTTRRLPIITSTLLVCSTIPVWTTAFLFYTNATASWQVSPAESRILNKECIAFQFFDSHDMWHFFSAFGMFLNFMFFFMVDDCGGGELGRRGRVENGLGGGEELTC